MVPRRSPFWGMRAVPWLVAFCLSAACGAGICQAAETERGAPAPPGKLAFDLARLDEQGLYGPEDGKRSLDYEYCIPRGAAYRAEVAEIDPSARFQESSPGRVGCGLDQVLVLGNTHQPGFTRVLSRIAALDYVVRIEPSWFE
jgi:hypothetical protein